MVQIARWNVLNPNLPLHRGSGSSPRCSHAAGTPDRSAKPIERALRPETFLLHRRIYYRDTSHPSRSRSHSLRRCGLASRGEDYLVIGGSGSSWIYHNRRYVLRNSAYKGRNALSKNFSCCGRLDQTLIRSTSSKLISSRRRSYSWVARVEAWLAIAAAFSRLPPLFK